MKGSVLTAVEVGGVASALVVAGAFASTSLLPLQDPRSHPPGIGATGELEAAADIRLDDRHREVRGAQRVEQIVGDAGCERLHPKNLE